MPVILTREELYDLVWKNRLRDLVEPFGLSEPTIRKRCRDKDIPLPGTGYWTKLAKGEATRKINLPLRGPGMDELVSTDQNPTRPVPTPVTDEELMGPVPDPPVFAQPLDEIRTHYLTLVLAKSRPIVLISMADGSCSGLHDSSPSWHLDAVSGSHPPHPLSGRHVQYRLFVHDNLEGPVRLIAVVR